MVLIQQYGHLNLDSNDNPKTYRVRYKAASFIWWFETNWFRLELDSRNGSHTSYFSIMYLLTSSMIIIYYSCNSITQIVMNVVFVLIANLNQNMLLIRLTKAWLSDLISL